MSKIEWTGETVNPHVGCDIKSAGCANCYAMRDAYRKMFNPNPKIAAKYQGVSMKTKAGQLLWTGRINFTPEVLLGPIKRKTPTVYFVDSMSDLFHENIPDEQIDQVFAMMALCPQHVFQVLTKRSDRMRKYFSDGRWGWRVMEAKKPLDPSHKPGMGGLLHTRNGSLPNVWLGVSVENQAAADERIPDLLATPAAVRWLSCEPLLGPVDLGGLPWEKSCDCPEHGPTFHALEGTIYCEGCCEGAERVSSQIDWVVVGGESGPGARDQDFISNARGLLKQCTEAGVPFFGKQGFKKQQLPEDLMLRQWPGFAASTLEVANA